MARQIKPSELIENKMHVGTLERVNEDLELKKNKDFAQLFTHGIDNLIELGAISPTALQIFLLFVKFMEKNNTIIIEQKEICEVLKIKRKATVSEAIKILVDRGYVARYKFKGMYVYFVNPYLASNTEASHKIKLMETFNSLWRKDATATVNKLCKANTDIVDTTLFSKKDKAVMRINFYNAHKDLQPPTADELIEHKEIMDKIDNDANWNNTEDSTS